MADREVGGRCESAVTVAGHVRDYIATGRGDHSNVCVIVSIESPGYTAIQIARCRIIYDGLERTVGAQRPIEYFSGRSGVSSTTPGPEDRDRDCRMTAVKIVMIAFNDEPRIASIDDNGSAMIEGRTIAPVDRGGKVAGCRAGIGIGKECHRGTAEWDRFRELTAG